MASVSYDAKRRPSFLYKLDEMTTRELPLPAVHRGGTRLVRHFEVRSSQAEDGLYLRAAVADEIREASATEFQAGEQEWIFLQGSEGVVRHTGSQQELLVPLKFLYDGENEAGAYVAKLIVEMAW